jgi:HK97 family phage prohead protease
MFLRKDRQQVSRGQRKIVDFAFEAATQEEITKAIGADVPVGYIAGWASTPDLDSYNHKVVKGAFADAIAKRGLRGPKAIKLLIGHDWNKLGGEIKVLEYRGQRLWIEAQLALQIGYVSDAYETAKMLGGLNFSVGFMLQDYEFKENADGTEYLQINRGDLFEVSVVPFPGNEEATMTFIKDGTGASEDEDPLDNVPNTVAEFEKALVASGLVKNRNDARSITQVIKTCPNLFKGKEEPASPEPETKGPVLDLSKITELSALVAKMKSVIAPVAS